MKLRPLRVRMDQQNFKEPKKILNEEKNGNRLKIVVTMVFDTNGIGVCLTARTSFLPTRVNLDPLRVSSLRELNDRIRGHGFWDIGNVKMLWGNQFPGFPG